MDGGVGHGGSTFEGPEKMMLRPELLKPWMMKRASKDVVSTSVTTSDRARCRSVSECATEGLSSYPPTAVAQYIGCVLHESGASTTSATSSLFSLRATSCSPASICMHSRAWLPLSTPLISKSKNVSCVRDNWTGAPVAVSTKTKRKCTSRHGSAPDGHADARLMFMNPPLRRLLAAFFGTYVLRV